MTQPSPHRGCAVIRTGCWSCRQSPEELMFPLRKDHPEVRCGACGSRLPKHTQGGCLKFGSKRKRAGLGSDDPCPRNARGALAIVIQWMGNPEPNRIRHARWFTCGIALWVGAVSDPHPVRRPEFRAPRGGETGVPPRNPGVQRAKPVSICRSSVVCCWSSGVQSVPDSAAMATAGNSSINRRASSWMRLR